jgi:hypothetical protein
MSIVFICDYCDWEGERENYEAHLKDSPTCDKRDACCKSESIKDYDDLEIDEICEDCTRMLEDYWEDTWTDILMESYYEGS